MIIPSKPVLRKPVLRRPRVRPRRDPILWTPDEASAVHTIDSLPARKKHIPSVVCIFGRRGQGKTLLCTTMCEQQDRRCEHHNVEHRLYSNYWMEAADRSYQDIVEELQKFPTWLNDSPLSTLGIDEIAELLPSLRAMSSDNLLTMGFLKQIRKRGVSVIMATQFPQEITMGILRQCDWFILSQSVEAGRHLRTYWWDWPGNITGNWGRKYFPPERDTHDFAVGYSNTYRMFGRYRTDEIIAPRFADERERIRGEQEERRKESQAKGATSATGSGIGSYLPEAIAAIVEDAAGSGVGIVVVEEISEQLRRLWKKPTAKLSEIVMRLRGYGVEVLDEKAEPYLVYNPPPNAPNPGVA